MRALTKLIAATSFSLTVGYSLSADSVKQTQDVLSEWISVEKLVSEEKSDWAEQKEVLHNSIGFMEEEISRLEEIIATAEETSSAGERKRAELEETKEVLDAATEDMRSAVAEYESRIRELSQTWPEAFLDSIRPVLKRMPSEEKAQDVPITTRLQNVVAILSQFDKFQSVVTKETGIQEIEGESREVTTLYFGFAYAYFVDSSGQYAGYGHPSEAGWKWVSEPSLSEKLSQFAAMYDQSVDAQFIDLPARIVTP